MKSNIDLEVIDYITKSMIADSFLDVHFIHTIGYLAESDLRLYKLLNDWMKDIENRDETEFYISEQVDYILALQDLGIPC